jgi:hypothetical protein
MDDSLTELVVLRGLVDGQSGNAHINHLSLREP